MEIDDSPAPSVPSRNATVASEPVVKVTDLVVRLGGRTILDGISFTVYPGDTLVIMGGSGCGKSTLLRHLIGVMRPESGSIQIFGQEITRMNEGRLDAIRLRYGMLFQSGALLHSLSVGENVALPLKEHRRMEPGLIDQTVKQKLEMVGLTGFEHLKPAEISGGMKKRVGLARALALDPELLFCDEPTSGLDPVMTAVVDQLLLSLSRRMKVTSVVVTHDMTSAFRIATQMIMLGSGPHQGRILASGTPHEIRQHPDPMLRQFIHGEADGPIPMKLSREDDLKRLIE